MSPQPTLTCVNCGTALPTLAPGATSVQCPVCRLLNDVGAVSQADAFTRESFEHSLGDLIAQARAGGLTSAEIVDTLRDELEFAAELAHTGRQICVQIIDLGPGDDQAAAQPVHDRATLLRGRALGG